MIDLSVERLSLVLSIFSPLIIFLIYLVFFKKTRKVFDSYKDKVVWITGASSGIGRSLALECARRGCSLILSGRNVENLNKIYLECKQILSVQTQNYSNQNDNYNNNNDNNNNNNNLDNLDKKLLVCPFDLESLVEFEENGKSEEKAKILYEKILEKFPLGVDAFISSGGISCRAPFQKVQNNFIHSIASPLFKINFFSNLILTKTILNHSIANKKKGLLIFISSVQGLMSVGNRSFYSASKHALQGFVKSLAYEVAPHGISTSLVCPGYVNTNLSLNAITSDGSKHGITDSTTASGYSSDYVARVTLDKSLEGSRIIVIADLKTRLALLIDFFLPNLLDSFMIKKMKKELL